MISRLKDLRSMLISEKDEKIDLNKSESTPLVKGENKEEKIDVWTKRDKDSEIAIQNFYEKVEEIQRKLDDQVVNIGQLKKHHLSLMTAASGESKKKQSSEIERETKEINQLNKEITEELQTMIKLTEKKKEESKGEITVEIRIREAQHLILSKRFQDLLFEFQANQAEFKKKYDEKKINAYKAQNPDVKDEEIRKLAIQDKLVLTKKPKILLESQKGTIDALYNEAIETNQDIKNIEQSLIELQEMFKIMDNLVDMQDDLIYDIEENITKAHEYVVKGITELDEAKRIQTKSGRVKQIILFVVIIIAAITLIILGGGSIPLILKLAGVI